MKKHINILLAASLFLVGCGGAKYTKIDRTKAPEASTAPVIKMGDYNSFKLENGLEVIVVENHKLPRVSFQVFVDKDPVLEKDAAGYTGFAGQLLREGTTNMPKEELDEAIDFIGARISSSANGMFGSSLKKHSETLLGLMSDILLNPAFPEEELEKIKSQTKSSLASSKTDANSIAGNVSSVLNYGKDHPYGEVMTEETVDAITVDMCKNYYNKYFKPNVSYLVVVGDVTAEEAKAWANKYFGKWEKGNVPAHDYDTPTAPAKTRVAFVDKPGAVQSVINVTYPIDVKPGSEDAINLSVMNSILGGGVFSGRLMQNLREDKGYTYGARSTASTDPIIGYFNAFASVRNEVTDSAVAEFLNELFRMVEEDVTEEDLKLVKNSMTGSFARSLESPQTVARFALNIARYDLPEDYYQTYLEKLNAITIEDVRKTAEKYIKPKNANILVVGNREEVAEKLKKFSMTGEIEYYDHYGNDYVALKPAPEGMTGDDVIAAHLKKVGGKEKLMNVKTLSVEMEVNAMGTTLNAKTIQKAPNKILSEMTMGTMVIQKQVFNGEKGKTSGMQGNKDMSAEEVEEMKSQAVIFPEARYKEMGYEATLLGIENLDGTDAYKIEMKSKDGDKSYEYYSVETGLKIREMSTQDTPQGAMTIIQDYADYKEVDGILFSFKRKNVFGPQAMESTVTKVEVNGKVDDKVFE